MYDKSEAAFKKAQEVLVGGVNSPVRAFKSVAMTPVFMDHGEGSKIYDIDGNAYIDYVLSWGPLILGHARHTVVEAIQEMAAKGSSFGAPTEIETELAQLVIDRVPSVEMIRMVNSGTEATMSAIRLARGVTGRSKIVKFEGCYHGHADAFLIKAGSGVATLGLPDSPGVSAAVAADTITLPYNDIETVKSTFESYGETIAAVIVEPVGGNMGCVPPVEGFLSGLREVTAQYGTMLIFDEVMTGFRVAYHCAQGLYEVQPDITCFGKIIGGGLPVGAYGGRRELMEQVAPSGPIYQAGTLSGNPLAMAAGLKTLQALTPSDFGPTGFDGMALSLLSRIKESAEVHGIPLQINQVGGMFSLFFTDAKVVDFETAKTSDTSLYASFFKKMLARGIYPSPSQFESWFLSTAHSLADLNRTAEAVEQVFAEMAQEMK